MFQNNTEQETPEASEVNSVVSRDGVEEPDEVPFNLGPFDLGWEEGGAEEYMQEGLEGDLEEWTEEGLEEEYFNLIEEDNIIRARISSIGCSNIPLSLSFQWSITPLQAIALFNSMVTANYPLSLTYLSIKPTGPFYRTSKALFYGIKDIGVPLKLSMYLYDAVETVCYINAITDAIRERTLTAPIILKLSCSFYIGGPALEALANMMNIRSSTVSLHLAISIFDNDINASDESGIKKILEATRQNSILQSLCVVDHIGSLAPALVSMLNQSDIPCCCEVYGKHTNEAPIQNMLDDSESNFLVSAILSPKYFLKRIGFDLYKKLQKDLPKLPDVLVKLVMEYWVEFYWADEEDIDLYTIIARQIIATIKATPGASNGNKYSGLNLNLLEDLYLMGLEEQDENHTTSEEASDVGESDSSPENDQASPHSSSLSPDDSGGGGVIALARLHDKGTIAKMITNSVSNQIAQKHNGNADSSDAEALLKALFGIEDLPESIQQQRLCSCNLQEVLALLEEALHTGKDIAYNLSSEPPLNDPFANDHDVTDNTTEYAKASQEALLLVPIGSETSFIGGIFADSV
jgi:hypothetical protein